LDKAERAGRESWQTEREEVEVKEERGDEKSWGEQRGLRENIGGIFYSPLALYTVLYYCNITVL
jgi:hypothetical protein